MVISANLFVVLNRKDTIYVRENKSYKNKLKLNQLCSVILEKIPETDKLNSSNQLQLNPSGKFKDNIKTKDTHQNSVENQSLSVAGNLHTVQNRIGINKPVVGSVADGNISSAKNNPSNIVKYQDKALKIDLNRVAISKLIRQSLIKRKVFTSVENFACGINSENKVINQSQGCKSFNTPMGSEEKICNNVEKSLRNLVRQNYHEETLDKSQECEDLRRPKQYNRKVPIYKQSEIDKENKQSNDLYEFIESDTDQQRPHKKKRKVRDKSGEFNKTTYNILQKINKKEARQNSRKKKKKVKEDYDKIIQEIVKKVIDKQNESLKQHINSDNKSSHTSESKSLIYTYPPIYTSPTTDTALVSTQQYSKSKFALNKANISTNITPEKKINTDTAVRTDQHFEDTFTSNDNFLGFDNNSTPIKAARNNQNITENWGDEDNEDTNESYSEELVEQYNSDDKFFGFDSVDKMTPVKINPNINIISEIVIKPNTGKSPIFRHSRPNINSTILPTSKSRPWRYVESLKRNPHFLTIKTSALPCLNQEMVLDHDQLDKIEQNFSDISKRVDKKKSPVQKSILNYISTTSENVENQENIPSSSLFDYEEFNAFMKTPITLQKNNTKRNVLAVRHENVVISTPIKATNKPFSPNLSAIRSNKINITYFGFDDTKDEAENIEMLDEESPYRISVNLLRKYRNRIKNKNNVGDVEIPEGENVSNFNPTDETEWTKNDERIRLFEDAEEEVASIRTPKVLEKKKRRKRLYSVDSEMSDEEKPKKKKKGVWTNAEEAEYEKWAAKTNAAFEEIDSYELEIE